MRTRRLLITASLTLLVGLPLAVRAEDGQLDDAVRFIRDAGNRLAALSDGKPSPAERHRRLQALLDDVVDVDGVARFCLGRYWNTATPTQQQDYLRLFHGVLTNAVDARVNDYPQGRNQVTFQPAQRNGDSIQVPTIVASTTGGAPVRVTWVLGTETGRLRIKDIVAEGMSLRITQRSDYLAFLAHNGSDVGALLRALRHQVGEG